MNDTPKPRKGGRGVPPEHERFAPPKSPEQNPAPPPTLPDRYPLIPSDEEQRATPELVDDEYAPPKPTPTKKPRAAAGAKPKPTRAPANPLIVNLFTGVLGLLTVGAVAFGVWAWQNPYHPSNPLALPTPFPLIVTATFLPPTETAVPVTATFTPLPISGLSAADENPTPLGAGLPLLSNAQVTPTLPGGALIVGDALITPTPPPAALYPFELDGEPLYIANGNGRECNWASVAGIVLDLDGLAIDGLAVQLTDLENGELVTVFTGSTLTFGEGGFELPLGNAPLENAYEVQLSTAAGVPLSAPVMAVTSTRCTQNVVLLNFKQVRPY